jgi:hypothetical protein
MGGWRERAHTHPGGSPRPGASRRSLKRVVRPAPPLPPEEALFLGYASGSRDCWAGGPQTITPSGGGANVGSRAPLIVLAGSPGSLPLPSTPPLPGWLQGAMGGPAVGEARRQPPAIIRSSSLGHWPATGSKTLPDPGGVPDEGQLLHHLRPSPPQAPGPQAHRKRGPSYQKQSKHQHINRVEVGVGKVVGVEVGVVVGEVDGESGSRKHL